MPYAGRGGVAVSERMRDFDPEHPRTGKAYSVPFLTASGSPVEFLVSAAA